MPRTVPRFHRQVQAEDMRTWQFQRSWAIKLFHTPAPLMQCPAAPPVALKLLPALGRAPQAYLRGEGNCKSLYGLRSCLAGAVIVAINQSGPCKGDGLGHGSQGAVGQCQGAATAEPGSWGFWPGRSQIYFILTQSPEAAAIVMF